MNNALLSRFANVPAIVSAEMTPWANECLRAVATVEHSNDMMMGELMSSDDDYWPEDDDWRASYRPYKVVDGTLFIPVKGMLLHDFGWQIGDYVTGYTYLRRAYERGMNDMAVQRIALVINSGGGEVAGNFDLVDFMYSFKGQKPVQAFVNEHAYSAAYSISSVADKISVTRTGGVGSIGVVTSHVDYSKYMDKMGIAVTFIHAGAHKVDGNPYEPLSEDVKKRMQARIDALYTIFVSTVSRNRNLSEESVRGTEALTFSAEAAIEIGLADEIASFDEALAAFVGGTTVTMSEEYSMTTKPDEAATRAAELEAARAQGVREGASAERDRIKAILGHDEAKSRSALAFHLAMNTEQPVEAAAGILAVSAPEKAAVEPAPANPAANAFENAMKKDNPEVGADGGKPAGEKNDVATILADMRLVTGDNVVKH